MKVLFALLLLVLAARVSAVLNLVIVGDETSTDGALCLDGTRPAYWIKRTNSTKWAIQIQGGGWCYNELDCFGRSGTHHGSIKYLTHTMNEEGVSTLDPSRNPLFYDWNQVLFAYCDGASFTGDREDPIEVQGKKIYFRGFRILKALVKNLLDVQGMSKATDVLLTGCSAGGLSTFLHADHVHNMLPAGVTFKAAPMSGYFLNHANDEGITVYPDEMKKVFEMHQASAGLPAACLGSRPQTLSWTCLFASEVYPFVQSPIFVINSMYDSWSMMCIFDAEPVQPGRMDNGNCTAIAAWNDCLSQRQCTVQQIQHITDTWGNVFSSSISSSVTFTKNGNGAFLFSCYIHCGECGNGYTSFRINGLSVSQTLTKWYQSDATTSQAAAYTFVDCKWYKDMCCNPTCDDCAH